MTVRRGAALDGFSLMSSAWRGTGRARPSASTMSDTDPQDRERLRGEVEEQCGDENDYLHICGFDLTKYSLKLDAFGIHAALEIEDFNLPEVGRRRFSAWIEM